MSRVINEQEETRRKRRYLEARAKVEEVQGIWQHASMDEKMQIMEEFIHSAPIEDMTNFFDSFWRRLVEDEQYNSDPERMQKFRFLLKNYIEDI